MTIEINTHKLLRTVARDIRDKGYSEVYLGKSDHMRDDDGKLIKLPHTVGVELSDKDFTYNLRVGDLVLFLTTVYSIAYTREFENPLIQVIFSKPYTSRPILMEANTYKILRNGITDVLKLQNEDYANGGHTKTKYKRKRSNY